jgi:nucleoside 2-deoxyribosyltransferase
MRKLKVYLAVPYQRKEEIKIFADELRAENIYVTSNWLNEPHKSSTQLPDVLDGERLIYAQQDMRDVIEADIFVLFADFTKTIVRAGRHVEFGIALAIGQLVRPMPIFVVGEEYENIFHYLPQVTHFETWQAIKARLSRLAAIPRDNYETFV